MQQQTITINTPVHIKASLNGEFRRFLLAHLTYTNLEATVKSLFNLPDLVVSLKFQDDENDWVLLTTDEELLYAVELAGSPLRLSVHIIAAVPVAQPKGCFAKDKCWKKKGKRHCKGWKKTQLDACQARVTAKIAFLEERANSQQLTGERERAVRWKISRLQERLEFITAARENLSEATPVCATEEQQTPSERWAERRDKWQKLRERLPPEVIENFRQTKAAFQAAKESGNPEEIETCKAAFFAAKKAKWEAMAALRKEVGGEFQPKCGKLRERLAPEILENLYQTKAAFQAAKESGNPEEIEACKAAFFAAKKAKWEAMAALRKEAGEECRVPKCRKVNALLPPEILENFRQAKTALQAAKEGGDRDQIVACRAAMKSARKAKWLAKAALRNIPVGEEQETK